MSPYKPESNDDWSLEVVHIPDTSGVTVSTDIIVLAISRTVPTKTRPIFGSHSTLLTTQTLQVAKTNPTGEFGPPHKSSSNVVKRSGSRENVFVKCGSKALKKPERAYRGSMVIVSFNDINIIISIPSVVASTAGTSTETSSTYETRGVEVYDGGIPTIHFFTSFEVRTELPVCS